MDDSSRKYNVQLKRIVGTVVVLPLMCVFPLILILIRNGHTMARQITAGYFLFLLASSLIMIFVVEQSLKRKHQDQEATGWLDRLIYSLDDTYERWSGRE